MSKSLCLFREHGLPSFLNDFERVDSRREQLTMLLTMNKEPTGLCRVENRKHFRLVRKLLNQEQ